MSGDAWVCQPFDVVVDTAKWLYYGAKIIKELETVFRLPPVR